MNEERPKEILKKLGEFTEFNRVMKVPEIYYTEGLEYLAQAINVWPTIIYIKPILQMFSERNILAITLLRNRAGGIDITYLDGYGKKAREHHDKGNLVLNRVDLLYVQNTLLLPNEYNAAWFNKGQ